MENKVNLSKNIRELRSKFGYTQAFVAQYLNLTPAAVNQYENDARSIPEWVIEKLALLYNIEEFDLYEENPDKQSIIAAFAFRTNEQTLSDIQTICKFKKIVNNYINMTTSLTNG